MSLLNDALKRAKIEALEREAASKGEYGLPTVPERAKRARWLLLLAGVVIGVVVLALIGAGIGWMVARSTLNPGQTAEVSSSSTRSAVGSPAATQAPEPDGATETTGAGETTGNGLSPDTQANGQDRQQTSQRQEAVPPSSTENRGASIGGRSQAASASQQPPTEDRNRSVLPGEVDSESAVQTPTGPSAQPSAQLQDGASFVQTLDTGDQRLELQGIAFRSGTSVAIINGIMLSAEDMVGGFQVIAIERERVQLQGRGVTVYLALR